MNPVKNLQNVWKRISQMLILWTLGDLFPWQQLMRTQNFLLSTITGGHLQTSNFLHLKLLTRRTFCASWLNRWSWLCYSKLYDGAFCLSCVLLGHQTGHNGSKLSKLFKEPLTNWQSAVTRLERHQKHSDIHRDSMLCLVQFRSVMTGETTGIDEQADNMRSARI